MISPWKELIIAGATAILMWIMGWVRTLLAKNIHVESPEAQELKHVVQMMEQSAAVQDAIMDTQILQSKSLRTVLEALTGKCNGNVKNAIAMIDAADAQFNAFLRSRVRSIPDEQGKEQ